MPTILHSASISATKAILIDVPVDQSGLERLRLRDGLFVKLADPIAEEGPLVRPRQHIRDVQFAFCSYLPTNLDDMAQLEVVQLASSGYSQVFGFSLATRGIRVCNARGVFDTAIAEWNVAMMINLARNLPGMLRNQQLRIWDRAAPFQAEIRGATVGFWGYGGIARQTARLCKSLGLKVHALTRSGVAVRRNIYAVADSGDPGGILPDRVYTQEERQEFLSQLDFLILGMPLTAETDGIVGASELHALPRGAFLLNPARGPLVQESALLQALEEGWIAGAAIDTHYEYPLPSSHPLWAFENVILTPHISGSSESPFFLQRVWDLFEQNVERYLSKRELLNELTPHQLNGH